MNEAMKTRGLESISFGGVKSFGKFVMLFIIVHCIFGLFHVWEEGWSGGQSDSQRNSESGGRGRDE